MKQSAQRSEPVYYVADGEPADDGYGGTTATGEAILRKSLVVVRPLKSSRLLEANQVTLRQGYEFEDWVLPGFEPKTGMSIIYRDERLTIEAYRYTDQTRRRYTITALEQANGNQQ